MKTIGLRLLDTLKCMIMINTLLKCKCDMNNRLLFVDTGLTLSDIGNDGVHLTDSGKGKLTRRIQCESLDFYRNISNRHM